MTPQRTVNENQILAETRIPARVPDAIVQNATDIAGSIVDALDYCGVLCVELFYRGEQAAAPLIVNEIAPRVHNSGHWTLDACSVSQFENHVRAVAGWPLGACARHADAIMRNLIGADAEQWLELAREENASIHLYGKRQIRTGRKMGHVTWLKTNGPLELTVTVQRTPLSSVFQDLLHTFHAMDKASPFCYTKLNRG